MGKFNRKLGNSFGKVSKLYNKRANYPSKIFRDILSYSKIKSNSKILDVGCGSGKSSVYFIDKGYSILGIDISNSLLGLARKNIKSNNFKIKVSSFEDFNSKERFDLILFGTSLHWTNPRGRYRRIYNLLKKDSTLAIFAGFSKDYQKTKQAPTIGPLYKKYCSNYPKEKISHALIRYSKELKKSKKFKEIKIIQYRKTLVESKKRYLDVIKTFSWVSSLKEQKREELLEQIKLKLRKYGSPIKISLFYTLVLAKRK